MSIRSIEQSPTAVRIVVDNQLVAEDVSPLRQALAKAPGGMPVEVDLREARSCQAHALLLLAQLVEEAKAPATYVGLTERDRRLLRYLGHEVGEAGQRHS